MFTSPLVTTSRVVAEFPATRFRVVVRGRADIGRGAEQVAVLRAILQPRAWSLRRRIQHVLGRATRAGRIPARGSSRSEEGSGSRVIDPSQPWCAGCAPRSRPPGADDDAPTEGRLDEGCRAGPGQLRSSQRLRSCRRICSETGQTSPPALPACHPRARSCAATLAADRGPSSLDGPGCPFIRRLIHSLRGPHM